MGGLARAAGEARLSDPVWLAGSDAVLAIAPDAPTLWLVDLTDEATRDRAEAVALLPGEAAQFAARPDAGERLLRRRLARLMLASASGERPAAVAIERDAAGAPIAMTPAGWHLSVAARWPHCVVGIAPMRLGVDIEIRGDPLPPDLLTQMERRDDGEVCRWAAKEAHAKWTRRPRELDPAAIETATLPLVTSRFGATRCWLYGGGDYVAAVCTA